MMYQEPEHNLSFWEELKPGYIYLFNRVFRYRHEDQNDRDTTVVAGFFLLTFIPWLPFIYLAHLIGKAVRIITMLLRGR